MDIHKKITMVGMGYIGLPTACVLANCGHTVFGYDVNEDIVRSINNKKTHFSEPGLQELLEKVVTNGKLIASKTPHQADVFIIAVPTPFTKNYLPDLSYIQTAAFQIAPLLEKGNLIILESTSPVGATEQLADWLSEFRSDLTIAKKDFDSTDIHIVYCPERIIPGKSLQELKKNDRIIGGITRESAILAQHFYKTIVEGECLVTNARTAEMCKLAENTYRDVNIALANEFSMICDKLDIDVWEMTKLANHHPRVNILDPGPGVGGHCIAVDPWFIVSHCPLEAKLIRAAREVNDEKPNFVLRKIENSLKGIKNPKLAILGITYKANSDDLRESPALNITKTLAHKGYEIYILEPNIAYLPTSLSQYPNIKFIDTRDIENEVDIVITLVRHDEFNSLAFPKKIHLDFTKRN